MILRSVLSNWLALGVTAATSIILTPLLIRDLGHFYFGLWVLVSSLVDYYGLLDVGIRTTLQRFVGRLAGQEDREGLHEVFATGFGVTAVVAALIMVLTGALAASPAHEWFRVGESESGVFRQLVLCLGASVAITLLARVLGAYLCGLQRFDLYNLGSSVATLLRALAMLAALRFGLGVVGVAVATLVSSALLLALNWALLRWIDPGARLSARGLSIGRARELFAFSIWIFVNTVGEYLRSYTSALVIGRTLGVAQITPFNVAMKLLEYLRLVTFGAAGPIMPAMSGLDGQQRQEALRQLLLSSTRMMALLVSFLGWLILLDGDELLLLWLGDGFQHSAELANIMLVGFVIALAQAPSTALLVARGAHKRLALWTLGEGVANVVLSVVLAQRYGLVGVALGMMVPMVIFKLLVQPPFVVRLAGTSGLRYFGETFARPLLVNLLFFAVALAAGAFEHRPGFLAFVIAVGWQTLVFLGLVYATGSAPRLSPRASPSVS